MLKKAVIAGTVVVVALLGATGVAYAKDAHGHSHKQHGHTDRAESGFGNAGSIDGASQGIFGGI